MLVRNAMELAVGTRYLHSVLTITQNFVRKPQALVEIPYKTRWSGQITKFVQAIYQILRT